MLHLLHSYCTTQSDHDIMIIVKGGEDLHMDFSVKKSKVFNVLVADAYNKYCHNIPFNQDALNVLPDAGDISTHSVSIKCVLPDSIELVDNINSASNNEQCRYLSLFTFSDA